MNNNQEVYQHWTCGKISPLQLVFPISKLDGYSSISFAESLHRRECIDSDCMLTHLGISLDGKNILVEDNIKNLI